MAVEPRLTLAETVTRELEATGAVDVSPALARLALVLAEALDRKPSALMAKELRDTLGRLSELSPPKREEGPVDVLRARRKARLAGRPAAANDL